MFYVFIGVNLKCFWSLLLLCITKENTKKPGNMSGTNSFFNWIYSWQRVPNPLLPILSRASYISHPLLFFKCWPTPPLVSNLCRHGFFSCFVSLTEWVISPHLVLFYLMTLWIYTCRALVSEYHKDQKFTLQSFKMSLLFKNDCLVKVTCLLIRFNKTKLDSIRLFPWNTKNT